MTATCGDLYFPGLLDLRQVNYKHIAIDDKDNVAVSSSLSFFNIVPTFKFAFDVQIMANLMKSPSTVFFFIVFEPVKCK